jgi:hypothetical protein
MTGFLDRLAARAQGERPLVRPRPRSRYESWPESIAPEVFPISARSPSPVRRTPDSASRQAPSDQPEPLTRPLRRPTVAGTSQLRQAQAKKEPDQVRRKRATAQPTAAASPPSPDVPAPGSEPVLDAVFGQTPVNAPVPVRKLVPADPSIPDPSTPVPAPGQPPLPGSPADPPLEAAPIPEREPAQPWSVESKPPEVALPEPEPEPWPIVPPTQELLRDAVVPALTAAGVLEREVMIEHGSEQSDPVRVTNPRHTAPDVLRTVGEPRTTRALRAESGPPEVHVHIGRVEVVRAAPPPVPPAPAPPRRPRPGPDHDAYLARRRENRR